MRYWLMILLPLMGYAQWALNDVLKVSIKNTRSFSLVSDQENVVFSPTGISTAENPGWFCLLDIPAGDSYLFSHVFADFEGENGITLEVRKSDNNDLLTNATLLENGSLSLVDIFEKRLDLWVYLPPHTTLFSVGMVRKREEPLKPEEVIVHPRVMYYPEGILSLEMVLKSPAWLEVELYNKRGDRLASLIPRAYYSAGPLSLQWTPLSVVKPFLMSGTAYVYIRYHIPGGKKEWIHRCEIVYL